MEFIKNSCICSSEAESTPVFLVADINFQSTKTKGWIRECCRCGSYFPEFIPSENSISQAYCTYYTHKKMPKIKRGWIANLFNRSRKSYLKRSTPRNATKIFDFGCGSGEFIRYLAANGYKSKLYAFDINKPSKSLDELAVWLELRDLKEYEGSFSWITLNHVVEHLHHPDYILSKLRMCLSENGAIWVSTPNSNSFLLDLFREYARDVDFPRHLHVMSMNAMKELLRITGYKKIEFISPPRINALLNMLHCVQLYVRCSGNHRYKLAAFLMRAAGRMVIHLCLSKINRDKESPEFIVVAR